MEFFVQLGKVAGVVIALVAVSKVPGISKPVRYLWRVLIADPFATWLRVEVNPILDAKLHPVIDRLDRIDGAVNHRSEGGTTMSEDVAETRERVERIEGRQALDHDRLRAIEDVITSPGSSSWSG